MYEMFEIVPEGLWVNINSPLFLAFIICTVGRNIILAGRIMNAHNAAKMIIDDYNQAVIPAAKAFGAPALLIRTDVFHLSVTRLYLRRPPPDKSGGAAKRNRTPLSQILRTYVLSASY